MKLTSFQKRVKRRITGREHTFFAVCQPGLKQLALSEMKHLGLPETDCLVLPGGIEFSTRLETCSLLNLNLRSPSRLLMRIDSFKADSFEKLNKKINAIDWILYLPQNCSIKFNVTTKKSRLYHTDAIAERCESIVTDQLNNNKVNGFQSAEYSTQTIYIRGENDQFTVSLDTSGDLLYKRGLKQKTTPAPLRENLAYAMLHWCKFSQHDVLIDPMCGSGSFSLEAAMIKANIPAGFYRTFSLEYWPGMSLKTIAFQKREVEKRINIPSKKEIFASDIDGDALNCLTQNLSKDDFNHIVDIRQLDFFDLDPQKLCEKKKGVIMLNPPYGKRLQENISPKSFYREIGKKLNLDFKGWRAGIILPSKQYLSYCGLKLDLKPIFHGGLDLFVGIGIP